MQRDLETETLSVAKPPPEVTLNLIRRKIIAGNPRAMASVRYLTTIHSRLCLSLKPDPLHAISSGIGHSADDGVPL